MKQIKTRIAGFNHHDGASSALTGMRPMTRLVLRPEPTNPHDKNAIKVMTTSGVMLGYIPKVDNELVLSRLNDKDVHVQAYKSSDTFNSIVLRYIMEDPLA